MYWMEVFRFFPLARCVIRPPNDFNPKLKPTMLQALTRGPMKFNSVSVVFSAILAISMPAQMANAQDGKVIGKMRANDSFIMSDMTFLGRAKPAFVMTWTSTVVDGKVAICGAVTFPDLELRSQGRMALRRVQIFDRGQPVMRDMSFFARVRKERDLDGAVANCASTGIVATPATDISLGWSSGSFKG